MSSQNEEVTVRLLKTSATHSAILLHLEGRRLELKITGPTQSASSNVGSLVEIVSSSRLYLGEVQGCRDERLIVHVEHIVDRDALERIGTIWHTGI